MDTSSEKNINVSFQNQKIELPESVLKKQQERLKAIEKNSVKSSDNSKEREEFNKVFGENLRHIQTVIEEAEKDENMDRQKAAEKISHINKQISLLKHFLFDSQRCLPPFEKKINESKIQELTTLSNKLEEKLLPRKKFAFRNMKKHNEKCKESSEKCVKEVPKDESDFVNTTETLDFGFSNKKNESLELTNDEIFKKHISLTNLESCVVKLNGSTSTVHMSNIINCKISLGPVSNSVFIDECTNSTLYITCHQLRMHHSSNCSVYLRVTSSPIIENCNQIKFAPNTVVDDKLFEISGLDKDRNLWDSVNDFNWLSSDTKSPNWHLIEESERKLFPE